MNEERKRAEEFLVKRGIKFTAVLIGSDCPPFCPDAKAQKDMDKVDTYPRKTHIHGKHYRCTFSRELLASGSYHGPVSAAPLVVDYWNCYRDEEFNALRKTPAWTVPDALYKLHGLNPNSPRGSSLLSGNGARGADAYSVMCCLEKQDPGGFEDWCSELGYSDDSREAERIWRMCIREWKKTKGFFTEQELVELQEIQ